MADRLYLANESDEILSALRFETKLDKAVLARMAFSLSLVLDGNKVPESLNFGGGEMRQTSFMGSDDLLIISMISLAYERSDIPGEELFSNRSIVKNHIDEGCRHLERLYVQSGKDTNKLLASLVDLVEFEGRRELKGRGLQVFLGKTALQNEDVVVELNNTAKHANSHLAIMGKPGVGKTQFLLKVLTDIRQQSNFQTNFIYFDYKGDVVDNSHFLEVARVQPFKLLQSGQTLPINPFVLPVYDEQTIKVSAREKAESFASINSKLGVVQKGALAEAIRAAYAKRAGTPRPYPDFQDVLEIAAQAYEEEGKKDDSLIEVLRDLADFDLFWKHGTDIEPMERLAGRTLLIDVHKMPVLKELVAYLVIERLYKEMASMPDSPIEENIRTIRTILVIDEAHNYLSQKNIFLQRLVREGRSKGVVVFFASQSPSDYQQDFFNFQELLEFAFIFQCEGVSAGSVQDILGCSSKTAKDLQTEIARLEPFQVVSRGMSKNDEFTKFAAEAFYRNY